MNPNRRELRLRELQGLPAVADLQTLLEHGDRNRGRTVELPFRTGHGLFVLTCRVERNADLDKRFRNEEVTPDPFWTLYGGEENGVLWSSALREVELVHDVLFLTLPNDQPSGPLKEQIAAPPAPPRTERPAVPQAPPHPAPSSLPPPVEPPPQPNYGYPQYQYPPGYPPPYPGGYYPYPGYPAYYPAYPQGYPAPYPLQPAPAYPQESLSQQSPPSSYPQSQPTQWQAPVEDDFSSNNQQVPNSQPVPFDRTEKGANVLIGDILTNAGLVPEATIEAALSLQPLVNSGAMSTEQAGEAVRRAHNRGGKLDPGIFTASRPPGDASLPKPISTPLGEILVASGVVSISVIKSALNLQEVVRTGALDKREAIDAFIKEHFGAKAGKVTTSAKDEKVIALLVKSGLLHDQDIEAAHKVKKKHGGEIVKILSAAGKLDKITFDAANACQDLIEAKRMKVEQAIIALHYCQRGRLSLHEAIDELGWERP